jgi:hypothetical protein
MKEEGRARFQSAVRTDSSRGELAGSKSEAGNLPHDSSDLGYAFALPRVVARLIGRRVRRAEFSCWEAYGFGILVFAISCVFAGRLMLPFVRPGVWQTLFLFFLPPAMWMAYLLLYFINAQIVAVLRRLGLYAAPTNNPFQHFIIMSLTTMLALLFLQDASAWVKSLGEFWLALLFCNLLATVVLKVWHEP